MAQAKLELVILFPKVPEQLVFQSTPNRPSLCDQVSVSRKLPEHIQFRLNIWNIRTQQMNYIQDVKDLGILF